MSKHHSFVSDGQSRKGDLVVIAGRFAARGPARAVLCGLSIHSAAWTIALAILWALGGSHAGKQLDHLIDRLAMLSQTDGNLGEQPLDELRQRCPAPRWRATQSRGTDDSQ